MMIDLAAVYHTGYAVPRLEEAQRFYAEALGIVFAPVHLYDPLRLWVPGKGWTEEWLRVTYSRHGPHHIELIEGRPGGFYDPVCMRTAAHTGLWAERVGDEVRRLSALGCEILGAKGAPEDDYGDMAYVYDPRSGAMSALVSVASRPRILAWFEEPFPR